jgi:hypothetical protein
VRINTTEGNNHMMTQYKVEVSKIEVQQYQLKVEAQSQQAAEQAIREKLELFYVDHWDQEDFLEYLTSIDPNAHETQGRNQVCLTEEAELIAS